MTSKQKQAVNMCLAAIAKQIPRKLVSSHLVDPKVEHENGEMYMVVKLGDVLEEMKKMIQVLREENESEDLS